MTMVDRDTAHPEEINARIEGRAARIAGQLNLVNADLVNLMADALVTEAWTGNGILSPSVWLAWQTGVSPERARDIVRVAQRRDQFPCLMRCFERGEISLEQLAVAVKAPGWSDVTLFDFVKLATVAQLRRRIRNDAFEGHPDDEHGAQSVADAQPDDRLHTHVTDSSRWRVNGETSIERGALIDAALLHARQELFESGNTHITAMDCLVYVCERYTDGIDSPTRRDRAKAWIHVDVTDGASTTTDGWRVPPSIRDLLLCDGVVQPVWETDGLPFSVGRSQRIVPERTRRLVQRRDRGCAVPGCVNHRHVEIHHILHWLEGGATDTSNLLTLCKYHHRLHHQHQLDITGDADRPDTLVFTDASGRTMSTSGTPERPAVPPPCPDRPYSHPYGGRLDHGWNGLGWTHPANLHPAGRAARIRRTNQILHDD